MAEIILTATRRDPEGTRSARRLRATGHVPGVVYGLGADPVNITVVWRELRPCLITEQGLNAVIHLEVDGERTPTLVKAIQRHKVRRDVLHVDFLRIDVNKVVEVEVPVVLEGEADAVKNVNGVVDQVLTALLVTAKPADIPAQITVDISGLEIGTNITVADLDLPAGVTTSVDAEEAVVTAQHGAVESGDEAADEAAAEDAGDDAEAEADGDDEAAEGGDEG